VSTPELVPCPFCGDEPYVHEPDFRGAEYQIGCLCADGDDGGIWRNGKTIEEAAENWNRRSSPVTAEVWQPIATAPKDGTEILVWCAEVPRSRYHNVLPAHVAIAAWSVIDDDRTGEKPGWYEAPTGEWGEWFRPTHWMALPAAPEEEKP